MKENPDGLEGESTAYTRTRRRKGRTVTGARAVLNRKPERKRKMDEERRKKRQRRHGGEDYCRCFSATRDKKKTWGLRRIDKQRAQGGSSLLCTRASFCIVIGVFGEQRRRDVSRSPADRSSALGEDTPKTKRGRHRPLY